MVIQKGSDLILELSVNPAKIRVHTTDPKVYIEITDFTDGKAYISADELRLLSSGVIAYTYYIGKDDQSFDDVIGTIYTDYYLQDTEENGDTQGEVTDTIKEYVDKAITAETDRATTAEDKNAEAIKGKQDILVSGTNIKTINGKSILGEGNITVEGGGKSSYVILRSTEDTSIKVDDVVTEIPANTTMKIDFNNSLDFTNGGNPQNIFANIYLDDYTALDNLTFIIITKVGALGKAANLYKINGDLAGANITNLHGKLYNQRRLIELDTSFWDVSKVTDMYATFAKCSRLTSLNVLDWDVSNVTDMSYMFYGCTRLQALEISNWNTGSLTDMSHIFDSCSRLESLDCTYWDLSKVTDASYAFAESGIENMMCFFNGTALTNISHIFESCLNLTDVYVDEWVTDNVTDISYAFCNCWNLGYVNCSNWDLSKVTNISGVFKNCNNLTDITFGNGWGKWTKNLTLDLSTCGSNKSYQLTDDTYNSMLEMYDRKTNGLGETTIKFSKSHNLPEDFKDKMTALGYTITLV